MKHRTSKAKGNREPTEGKKSQSNQDDSQKELAGHRFGPLGLKKRDQLWSRAVLTAGVLIIVIVTKWRKSDVVTWASGTEKLLKAKAQPLICSQAYLNEINKFPGITLNHHFHENIAGNDFKSVNFCYVL